MSKGTQAALRRARLREIAGPAELEGGAEVVELEGRRREAEVRELAGPPGTPERVERPAPRPSAHVLELTEPELEELGELAQRGYSFARALRDSLDHAGRISEAAAWNARDALEDDTGRTWPSKIPMATRSLSRKLTALFNEVP